MIKYTQNKKSGEWQVIGPVSELKIGSVVVTKNDGTTNIEQVINLSKTFKNDSGELLCFGYLARSERKSSANYWISRITDLVYEAKSSLEDNPAEFEKFSSWISSRGEEAEATEEILF